MERKNYLVEKLSKKEKSYLKRIVINRVNRYIRDNYFEIKSNNISFYDEVVFKINSFLTIDFIEDKLCQKPVKNLEDIVIENMKLYYEIKALSDNEKTVLLLLFYENKSIKEVSEIMNVSRWTVSRLKESAFRKIILGMRR